MIINRYARTGVFEKTSTGNESGLLVVDFSLQEKRCLEKYADWEAKSMTRDGKRIAITRMSSHTKSLRTDLVIFVHKNQDILFTTSEYFVYDATFDSTGDKLLIVAHNRKPFCYDFSSREIIAELPVKIRTYRGDLDHEDDIYLAPCEKRKGACCLFDFKTGQTEVITLKTGSIINNMKFSGDLSRIYAITENNMFYCFNRKYDLVWVKDFTCLGKQAGCINASGIYGTECGKYLCLQTSSTESNSWGAEYVVDSSNGEIVRQIEGYPLRGRLAANFFGTRVLLHTLKTLDLTTGEVSEHRITI